MLDKLLFCIPAENHKEVEIRQQLLQHPEMKFVSLAGVDIDGHDTDEKIPVERMLEDMDNFLRFGVQTDGSAVVLPEIASLSNAKVDIIPDLSVNWFVDYNYQNIDPVLGLPVGTLRIPSILRHNGVRDVGARVILRNAVDLFKRSLIDLLKENPHVFEQLPIDSADDIEEIQLSAATELEFYVRTPQEDADRDRLHTSQELKEQYWKRTFGPVRSALEKTLDILERYGFHVEMGHKEVGGVKPVLLAGGEFDHIMEQLEIDWRYSNPMQAADNDAQIRYIIKDIFRMNGLDVTFMAKPVKGVAGNGKHAHMGVVAKLKDGRRINLFSAKDPEKDYMSPIGYGALMGILRNYEVLNPLANYTNDALNRLKPGFEAPISINTSLGLSVDFPSRNRTVLCGLIRDARDPMATRFELRSPNAKSNSYLVFAGGYLAMLDGIRAALASKKTPGELCASISKAYGKEDFYLEKDRLYRTEKNVYDDYTQEERDKYFGFAPVTVWENIEAFDRYPEKTEVLLAGGAIEEQDLKSYKSAVLSRWLLEIQSRKIPEVRNKVRSFVKKHDDADCADIDELRWDEIKAMRIELARDTIEKPSLLSEILKAVKAEDYSEVSRLQKLVQNKVNALENMYSTYLKNII